MVTKAKLLAPVVEKDLFKFSENAILIYGTETNESRSIPAIQDGMKPVVRRLMWSANYVARTQTKSARLAGDCIGRLHPHSDAAAYQACVTQVNAPVPLFVGVGNWGTLIDPPAEHRYTNVFISDYGFQFLGKDYLAVTPMVPNYDDKEMEPVYLPALLPNILLNDNMGIGVGVTTNIPAFTPVSLLKVLCNFLDKVDMTDVELTKALVFHEPWGGKAVQTADNKRAIRQLMSSPSSTILFESPLEIERDAKRVTLRAFAPGLNIEKFVENANQIPQVDKVYAGKGLCYIVQVKHSVNLNEFDQVVGKLQAMTRTKQKYRIYVSDRSLGENGKTVVKFHSLGVKELLMKWLKFRVQLEAKCLDYRIGVTEKGIEYLKLLIKACDSLDIIFAGLRKPDPALHISKGMKITLDEAKQILELKVRQLSKLDQDTIKGKMADEMNKLKVLQQKRKAPSKVVKSYFESCIQAFTCHDERLKNCYQWWLKTPKKVKETEDASE